MLELAALLLSAFILFMFGISLISFTVIAVIMVAGFILFSTLSFIFKFAFWALLALFIYFFFNNDKDCQ